MKPEAQRIAIAMAMPAGLVHFENGTPLLHLGGDRFMAFDPLNDLNAMHEAEKLLTSNQRVTYLDWLDHVTKHIRPRVQVWHATAAQRAEAFLRTIGLWSEE